MTIAIWVGLAALFVLFVFPVFKCFHCKHIIWFKAFGFYGTLSHRTYCKPCYQELKKDGTTDLDLI